MMSRLITHNFKGRKRMIINICKASFWNPGECQEKWMTFLKAILKLKAILICFVSCFPSYIFMVFSFKQNMWDLTIFPREQAYRFNKEEWVSEYKKTFYRTNKIKKNPRFHIKEKVELIVISMIPSYVVLVYTYFSFTP